MIRFDSCLDKVNNALLELERNTNNMNPDDVSWTERSTKQVLEVMKENILQNKAFNGRLISAFKDVAVISARNYNGTELESAINSLSGCLRENIPNFMEYKPLGMDFGKGEPF